MLTYERARAHLEALAAGDRNQLPAAHYALRDRIMPRGEVLTYLITFLKQQKKDAEARRTLAQLRAGAPWVRYQGIDL